MMTPKSFVATCVVALLMAACTKKEKATTDTASIPPNEALKTALTGYFAVKDALVADEATAAQAAAAALAASTGEYAGQLDRHLKAIAATSDIEVQRKEFESLSVALYEAAKAGGAGMTVYKQYCPMAFNDQGAFWLSSEKKILNPYFGASMLRCGTVKEEIN